MGFGGWLGPGLVMLVVLVVEVGVVVGVVPMEREDDVAA